MKTQLSKPSRTKARYTEEYKQEALELWRNSGRSAAKVAAELGIRAPLLYRWARPKRQSNSSASESKSKRSVEELEAQIRRLQAENAKLLEQREVLKKSLGILSEAPPRGMPESNKGAANTREPGYATHSWSRAVVITPGSSVVVALDHANWRTFACVSASGRSLLAVAKPTAVRAWPRC